MNYICFFFISCLLHLIPVSFDSFCSCLVVRVFLFIFCYSVFVCWFASLILSFWFLFCFVFLPFLCFLSFSFFLLFCFALCVLLCFALLCVCCFALLRVCCFALL